MFRIEPALERGVLGDDKMVVDHERDVWLQRVSGLGPEPGDAFKLVWGGRVIPFETVRAPVMKSDGSTAYYLAKFRSFGSSGSARLRANIPVYRFQSDEERQQAMMLAAEALIEFGDVYNGDQRPEGYNRVQVGDHIFTRSSFAQ